MKLGFLSYLLPVIMIAAGVSVAVYLIVNCHDIIEHDHHQKPAEESAHEKTAEHSCAAKCDHDYNLRQFTLTPEIEQRLGLTLSSASNRRVADSVTLPGCFEWKPQALRSYGVPLGGFVEISVQSPQHVKQGEILFTVDSTELREMLLEIEINNRACTLIQTAIDVLQRRIDVITTSGSRNAELEAQLQLKTAELQQAKFTVESMRKKLRQTMPSGVQIEDGALIVRAIEDGFVQQVDAVSGNWCETGRAVVLVAQPQGLRFKAEALTAETRGLRDGLAGEVQVLTPDGAGVTFNGSIIVGFADNTQDRTMPVYVELQEVPEWIRTAMPGVVRVGLRSSPGDAVVIPSRCVFYSGLETLVFVSDPDHPGSYFIRKVQLGVDDGDYVEITDGMRAGEKVVAEGVYQLRSAYAVSDNDSTQQAGHFHADGEFHAGEH